MMLKAAAAAFLLLLQTLSTVALPPPDPVRCNRWADDGTIGTGTGSGTVGTDCSVTNYLGSWSDGRLCRVSRVVFPTTHEEIIAAVAYASRHNISVKVISSLSHSLPPVACPRSTFQNLLISTRNYNRHLSFDTSAGTVTTDSGTHLSHLVDAAAAAGFSLPNAPYWSGVSLGGLLATGSYGSSFFGYGGALHDSVVALSVVVPASAADGYAKAIELTPSGTPDEFNAARVSLGVLGVISKVTLQLEPLFKRSITYQPLSDADLETRVLRFPYDHEFADITWHPSIRTAVYRIDDRTSPESPGDGVYDYLGFQPILPAVVQTTRALEETYEATEGAAVRCAASATQVASLLAFAQGLKNDAEIGFTGYPVIGYSNRMQTSSSCISSGDPLQVCAWDSRIAGEFYDEMSYGIAADRFPAFIADVKSLRDSAKAAAQGLCGLDLYAGILIRYVKGTTAFLSNGNDTVHVDITYYRSRGAGRQPRLLEDVLEEVEQMILFKYGGLPHWGKNRPISFANIWRNYPLLPRFLAVKQKLDPNGLFSNDWTDAVLGLSDGDGVLFDDSDGCAIVGFCICSDDSHCAPSLGYYCRPGRVYSDARVCRKEV